MKIPFKDNGNLVEDIGNGNLLQRILHGDTTMLCHRVQDQLSSIQFNFLSSFPVLPNSPLTLYALYYLLTQYSETHQWLRSIHQTFVQSIPSVSINHCLESISTISSYLWYWDDWVPGILESWPLDLPTNHPPSTL